MREIDGYKVPSTSTTISLQVLYIYNRRNPFEGLVEFKGSPKRDNLEVGLENPGSFPNMMNFFNFKNFMKWNIPKIFIL
jgi:hypothetical protein